MLDPATMPPQDGCIRRGVFRAHIYRRPVDILFRGVALVAAKTDPSLGRKVGLAGYTQEVTDLEIMVALPNRSTPPEANSSDEVRVYDQLIPGQTRTYKDYRIISVQTDTAPDCYQLSLSLRRR